MSHKLLTAIMLLGGSTALQGDFRAARERPQPQTRRGARR